jgi:transcriptional regulator with XRE-family HTH domain
MSGTIEEVGARLRLERLRIGLDQAELAQRVGVSRNTQGQYESGKTPPKADYLLDIEAHGVDIGYVLTGRREAVDPGDIDQRFLDLFRSLDRRRREALMDFLLAFASAPIDPTELVGSRRLLHDRTQEFRGRKGESDG